MSSADLRPLSLGELLDRTFTLYRNHFWLFVGIMAVPQLLILAIGLVGVAIGSLAVNESVAVLPTFAHSGATVSGSLSDLIVTAESVGDTPSTAVSDTGVTAVFGEDARSLRVPPTTGNCVYVTVGVAPVESAGA